MENEAWAAYEKEYEKTKNEIMSKLDTIKSDIHTHKVYREWLEQVIEFIKEQKG